MSPMIGLLVGAAALTATAASAQAPTGQIQGTVRGESGAPLGAVTVTVTATRFGGVTGSDGRYTITAVPPGTYRVRARVIGYGTAEDSGVVVLAGQSATADFQLKAQAIQLDAIVAVGYGTQLKKDLTGSVASVSSKDIETSPVARVDEAIAGLVPGVQIQATSAAPGSDSIRLRVRGGNSVQGNNKPLVVVDGVIDADLNQINPGDLESVDILKDASATAIYGARGANGVILVTTKRGPPGQVRFEYSGYGGGQEVSKHIPVLNASQFALLYMRNPNHDKSVGFDTVNALPTTNWQDLVYHTAPIQSHEIRVTGSTGGTSLMFSANWLNQEGVVRSSDFGRGSVRFNLDQDLSARARLGARLSYSRSVGNEDRVNDGYGSSGGPLTMEALRFAPTIPVYDSAGKFSGPLFPSQTMDNPVAMINLLADKTTTDYLIGNVFGEYDLVPGLTLRSSLSYTSRNRLEQRYTSMLLRASLGSGQANIDNNDQLTWLSENTVTLRRTLGRHDVTLLGGLTAEQTRIGTNTEQGVGFTSDQLGYKRLNLASLVTGNSSSSQDRLASFFGRVNYSFAGKYLVTGTIRTDGSSKFAVNNKWATFPSAAVAWRVSDEPFFHRLAPVVSGLKVRLSAGQSGSEAINPYQSLAAWSLGAPYAIGTLTFLNGAHPSRNANANLRWETTTQYDAGLDLNLFDNRVSFTADAYHKITNNLLYSKQVPYFTGFESYVTNIGKVQNNGLELALDTRHTIGALELRLGGNLSLNRSKVLDLGGDQRFFMTGSNTSLTNWRDDAIIQVGQPLGNFYGYVWDGIFQDSAEVAASHQPGAVVGGMKLKDLDSNDSITTTDGRDKTVLGNGIPRYLFGLTGSVAYKGLSLSWIVRGALDFQVVNVSRAGMESPGGSTNMLPSVLKYWSPTNHTNTMTAIGVGPYDALTSRWVEDGSFVRLQNVTVGWELPPQVSGRLGMRQLRVYLSAQNLFTATRYSWYDPEISSRGTSDLTLGWDDSGYPGTKTVTFGVNVGF
ncbi:MAG TPA: TonB-dependent receptor [Gemmatimonadales bacterium]|nr:TonB-dependent receptor [Gemmatimonadales bacterium]